MEAVVRNGLAKYEYRHFIIFGAQSEFAALATECAGDQDRWWAFHDEYMQGKVARYSRAGAIGFAEELGLDTDEFAACLDDQRHLGRLMEMQRSAVERGILGTPTVIVNGRFVGTDVERIIEAVREMAGVE